MSDTLTTTQQNSENSWLFSLTISKTGAIKFQILQPLETLFSPPWAENIGFVWTEGQAGEKRSFIKRFICVSVADA